MGATESKSSLTALNDSAMSVCNQSAQKCVGITAQEESVEAKDVKGDVKISGVKQKQSTTVNMKCLFSNDTQTSIQEAIADDISNKATTKGGDLFTSALGKTKSDVKTAVLNIFKSNVDVSSMQQQVSKTLQEEKVEAKEVDGNVVISDIDQDQTTDLVVKAMFENTGYSKSVADIADKIDSSADGKAGGLFNLFGNGTMKWLVIGLIILALVGGIAYMMMSGGSSSSSQQPPPGAGANMMSGPIIEEAIKHPQLVELAAL